MKNLIVLDFDGTIYRGDSMLDFAKFNNLFRYIVSLFVCSPLLVLSWIKIVKRDLLKKVFVFVNFKGKSKIYLNDQGVLFFKTKQSNLFPSALSYIKKKQLTNDIVIVSGSFEEWLTPFCNSLNVPLICSKLLYDDHKNCTGKLLGNNIVGKEKVKVVKSNFDLSLYEHVFSFGNSKSDQLLSQISTDYFHKKFND